MKALTSYPILDVDRLSVPAVAETVIAQPSEAFEKTLDAWRQVERALSRVGRLVANARNDPTLQTFWRGVERDLEAQAHQLALRVGEEAIRLSRIDLRRNRRGVIFAAAGHRQTQPAKQPSSAPTRSSVATSLSRRPS